MAITPQSTVSNKTAIDLARVLGATPQQIAGLTSSLSSPQATKATIAAGQASPTGQIYPTSPTNLTVSAPSVPTTISADTLKGSATPINLPPSPTYSNPGLINTGGLINALAPTYKLNPETRMLETVPVADTGDAAKNETNAALENFKTRLGLIPQKENVLQSPEILAQQAEVQKMKQEVNNYTSQLNSVIAKQNQDLLSLRETGSKEGVTEAVYGGQQATINREAAIKALPLQAAISASQGNLQLAQDYLQQLTAIKTEAVNNDYQYKMAQYEAISGFLTREETIRMEALKEKRTQEREDRLNNISAQENWSKIALQNGQSGLMVSINALDPNSPTFRSSLAAITSGIVDQGAVTEKLQQERLRADISKINADTAKIKAETTTNEEIKNTLKGEYADIINSASNLVGAEKGKTSKIAISEAIAKNDFPSAYAQIANNVEDSLTGEVKTKFANSRIDYNVMLGMRDAIQEFDDAGGNLGYLKGTADEIARRFGQLSTDPKFAALAVQLQREFQTYRLNMTGAAFSPEESREYAAVNPRTTASIDLNLATIDGALNQLENRITSTVNSKIPNAKKIYSKISGGGMSEDDAYNEYLKGQSSGFK